MNKLFSKVYMWMTIGLLVTFATGFLVKENPNMLENIFEGWGYLVCVIAELALVIFLSARVMKMQPTTAKISFLLYSFVSGLTFSSIFVVYDMGSIINIFLITAGIFAFMSFIGYTTKIDLTKIGTYLFMGLIAAIIVTVVNIFLGNDTLAIIISIACVLIFIGITAYDVQKIKYLENANLPTDNIAIFGALDLYLDFINIFLHLLQLFGRNND